MIFDENHIRDLINKNLDVAEKTWEKVGEQLLVKNQLLKAALESVSTVVPSQIPGYPLVVDGESVVDEFIAFVADMRNSSEHLMCAISPKHAKISGLQRIYYETTALLPALAKIIRNQDGNVTEYLGDGVLALFRVDKNNKSEAIYAANRAATQSIKNLRELLNNILSERYQLPPIDIGIGLSYSKALVTLVGLDSEKQAKVFGECVFRATKLSSGTNQIIVDDALNAIWPTAKGGPLTFHPKTMNGVSGYVISHK